jgi:hypothetical protein
MGEYMTRVDYAHQKLVDFCTVNGVQYPGIAIGQELLTYLVKGAVELANNAGTITYPTTTRFEGLEISFSGTMDAAAVSTTILGRPNPGETYLAPEIEISNLTIEFAVYLDGVEMSRHRIAYDSIIASVIVGTAISLSANSSSGRWVAHAASWQGMANLPDGKTFTDEMKDEWRIQEAAILLIGKDQFGPTFAAAIDIPNVLKSVEAFQFVGSPRVGASDGLIMFSGPASWNIGCPRRAATPNVSVTNTSKSLDNDVSFDTDAATSPDAHYPPMPNFDGTTDADIFVHLPTTFVKQRFDGVVKPAAGFADQGNIGPIHWHYESAIAVEGVEISLQNVFPLELKLSVPSKAFGSAGAGIKIGCIYYEAAGLAFDGRIDPLDIWFRVGLDVSRGELYFESRLGAVSAHDFQFHHWPNFRFPFDEVADFVLARVAEVLINGKAGDVLALTRFKLVDFQLFKRFGRMQQTIASAGDQDQITMGLSLIKT